MTLTLIIVLLVALALLLFAVEAFITPGLGFAGIAAAACVIVADVLVYSAYGTTAAILAVLVSAALTLLFFWWLSRPKAFKRIELDATISGTAATADQLSVSPGDEGRALTRLALIGNADIGGRTVEVKSDGGFIDEGTPVVVTRVSEALILVKPKD